MFQTTYLLECVYSKKCIILESKTRFATKISSNWDIVHLSPNCWQYISNTNYCHQRTSLNNKLLFTLSKADSATHIKPSIQFRWRTIQSNNWLETISMIFVTFRSNIPGAQFAAPTFFRGPICRGPICWGPICQGPICWGPIYWGPICRGPICRGPICQGPICRGPILSLNSIH